MRSFACVLSILLCSQVALLASAEDNDDGMRRLVRNRNQASQVAMSVSASGDASEVSESMMELQDAVQVSSAVQDILDEVEEMAPGPAHGKSSFFASPIPQNIFFPKACPSLFGPFQEK